MSASGRNTRYRSELKHKAPAKIDEGTEKGNFEVNERQTKNQRMSTEEQNNSFNSKNGKATPSTEHGHKESTSIKEKCFNVATQKVEPSCPNNEQASQGSPQENIERETITKTVLENESDSVNNALEVVYNNGDNMAAKPDIDLKNIHTDQKTSDEQEEENVCICKELEPAIKNESNIPSQPSIGSEGDTTNGSSACKTKEDQKEGQKEEYEMETQEYSQLSQPTDSVMEGSQDLDIDSDSQEAMMIKDDIDVAEEAGEAFGTEMEEEYNVKSPTRNGQESSTSKEPSRSEVNAFDVLMKGRSQKDDHKPIEERSKRREKKFSSWSDRDTEDYRNGYPGKKDRKNLTQNYRFYANEISSHPNGDFIENIHKKWWGNYDLLETHHGYIQWLFPIREQGLNWSAHELQLHEAYIISSKSVTKERVLKSYKMMLDFYGIKLTDEVTGQVDRAPNWHPRFMHLNRSYHNYLRITRILKCLGEMGFEHLKAPLIGFMIDEALKKRTLKNAARSCKDYWVHTLRNDGERATLLDYIWELEQEMRCREGSSHGGKGDLVSRPEVKYAKPSISSDVKGKKDNKDSKSGGIKKFFKTIIGKSDK